MNNEQRAIAKQERVKLYYTDPKICPRCSEALTYDNRNYTYCSLSCGAAHRIRPGKPKHTINCQYCAKPASSHKNTKYCSSACQREEEYNLKTKPLIMAGKVSKPTTLKRYLKREVKDECFICGITHWQGIALSLQLDHIDGDASNNFPVNLRLLCPNCHSLTPSFTGKNRGFGRKSRGLKRQD